MRELQPGLGRRERKKQAVERRIQEEALRLFRERGYEATTVEEIAEAADVAKGTFFNYFPRKDVLLEALAQSVAEELLAELGPAEGWTGSGREQLLRLYLRLGEVVAGDRALTRVMMIENMRRFWMRAERDPLELRFRALVRTVLERAVAGGEVAAETEVEIAVKLLEAAYVTTVIEFLWAEHDLSDYRREMTEKVNIIFRGLAGGGSASKEEGP